MLNPLLAGSPASADSQGLRVEVRPGIPAVVEIDGEIDIASAPWLHDMLLQILRRQGPVICADLHGVTFLDCSGVNMLLRTARRARLEGGYLRVVRPSACTRRIITLLGIQGMLTDSDEQVTT